MDEQKRSKQSDVVSSAKRSKLPDSSALSAVVVPKFASTSGALTAKATEDLASRKLDNAAKHEAIRDAQSQRGQRRQYARRTFWLVSTWITIVLLLLLFEGFGSVYPYFHFHLSDKVLMVAVGSTTVNILGMLAIVLHGLFRDRPPDHR